MVRKHRRAHLSRSGEHLSFEALTRPVRSRPSAAALARDLPRGDSSDPLSIEIQLDVMRRRLPNALTSASAVWLAAADRQKRGCGAPSDRHDLRPHSAYKAHDLGRPDAADCQSAYANEINPSP